MRLFDRYVGYAILTSALVVMLVLLSLQFFVELVAQFASVGKGNYTMTDAFLYALRLVPRQIYEIFPLTAMLGGLLGLGRLSSSGELTVFRAAGISIQRITVAVLKAAAVLAIFVVVIGEWVAPILEKQASVARAKAIGQNISYNTDRGLWGRAGNAFVNIGLTLPDKSVRNIFLYVYDGHHLREMIYAKRAVFIDGHWLLQKVERSRIDTTRVTVERLDEMRWEAPFEPEVINLVAIPPERLSVADLSEYIAYLDANQLDARSHRLAFWVRLIMPLTATSMVLLSVPFVFGSLRAVTVGQRLMTGTLVGLAFYIFNGVFSRMSLVFGLPVVIGAILPVLVVMAIWVVMIRRLRFA